jgi:pyruvate dehydrogenase E2 component (dihydrolipoamide acetyltransferase)
LLVEPGTLVDVGAPLAIYVPPSGEQAGAAASAAAERTPAMRAVEPRAARAADQAPKLSAAPPSAPPPAAQPATPEAADAERVRVSPAARRRALELGLELAVISATGAEGAITLEDVERAAVEKRAPVADMRQVIGQAMSRAKREIPHYYLGSTIDMTAATAWLEQWNAQHPVTERLLPGALLVKAVARALETFAELNGFWLDGKFEASREINIGIAIRLRRGGLIAPGLDAANRAPLPELMRRLQDLVQRARAGRLSRNEITNATITLSSLGEGGVETVFPIIYPPQVAIVGFGSIVTRPWVVGGKIAAAPVVTATLSADHRVSDGHRGSQFLAEINRLLQQPEQL